MRTLRSPNGQTIYTHETNRNFDLGDLNGDGHDEIVAGFSMSSDAGFDDHGNVVLVLDSEGDLLASKSLEYGFQSIDIVPAQAGRDAWISIVSLTGITRVDLK